MREHNDDFFNKLYAIQPFKEIVSPSSSNSKKTSVEMCMDSVPQPVFEGLEPRPFLEEVAPLRKNNSEQPAAHDPELG